MMIRIRRGASAALVAASLLVAPAGVARADGTVPETGAGVRRLMRFASCVFALAAVETPTQAASAMLLCGRVLFDESQ